MISQKKKQKSKRGCWFALIIPIAIAIIEALTQIILKIIHSNMNLEKKNM